MVLCHSPNRVFTCFDPRDWNQGRWSKTVVRISRPAGSARVYEACRTLLCISFIGKRAEEANWNDEGSFLPVAIAQLGVGLVVIEDLACCCYELVLGVLILAVGLPLKWFGLMMGIFLYSIISWQVLRFELDESWALSIPGRRPQVSD